MSSDSSNISKWLNAIAIFVPLMVAALAYLNSINTQTNQARAEFTLKASEMVLASSGLGEAQAKVELLRSLFPEWVPADFGVELLETPDEELTINTILEQYRLRVDLMIALLQAESLSSLEREDIESLWYRTEAWVSVDPAAQ